MTNQHIARFRTSALPFIATAAVLAGGLTVLGTTSADAASVDTHGAVHASAHEHATVTKSAKAKKSQLRAELRTLWDQHMQWTYSTIVAFAEDSPGLEATVNRLLKNQVDLGNAIKPYYGKAAGNHLTKLLTTHIQEAVPVLAAAKAGDAAALDKAVKDWYANARDIADFLASANPNWARSDMRQMMRGHITQTIGYAGDVLAGHYAKAITDYDKAQRHMDHMADMLSRGIIAQFPKKF